MRLTKVFTVAVIGSALMLSACNKDGQQPQDAGGNDSAKTSAQAGRSVKIGGGDVGTFANKLIADGKGVAAFDRETDPKSGKQIRQVFIESLGQTPEQAEAAAKAAMVGTSFVPGPYKADDSGIRMTFRSNTNPPIRVLIRNKDKGPRLRNPDATSSIYITQDPTAAPAKQATVPAAAEPQAKAAAQAQ